MSEQPVTRDAQIAHARAVADMIRKDWPAKAAEIEQAIAEVEDGRRDGITVTTGIRFKLEKFHGPIEPGQEPFETIQGQG